MFCISADSPKSYVILFALPPETSCIYKLCIPRHYNDVIMGAMASQFTSLTIVYSTVYSGADQRKHQSSASLAFVRGIHRWPVNSPHKGPVTRKMFPFDDVIMVKDYISAGKITRKSCPKSQILKVARGDIPSAQAKYHWIIWPVQFFYFYNQVICGYVVDYQDNRLTKERISITGADTASKMPMDFNVFSDSCPPVKR